MLMRKSLIWRYLYMEITRAVHLLPRMISEAILLMAFIGMIAFCGVRSMEKEPLAVGADIAVAMQEENAMTQMALKYIEGMESVSSYCRFVRVSEAEGRELLQKGKVAALIILPRQLVEGIMNGTNPPVEILFPAHAGIEAMLFKELTEAGESLLTVAQAEIYGAYDTAAEYGMLEDITAMYADIDNYNLAFALDRLALYDSNEVSATGRLSVVQYYAASAVTLMLMLLGMALYPFMQPHPLAFRRQLRREGIGNFGQGLGEWLCGLFGLCSAVAALFFIGRIGIWIAAHGRGVIEEETLRRISRSLFGRKLQLSGMQLFLIVILMLVMATAYIYFLYSLSRNKTTGVLLLFLMSVAMLYASGGFVPSFFLPEMLQRIGSMLPASCLIQAAGGIMAGFYGKGMVQCVTGMAGYTIIFGGLAYLCRRVRSRS